MRIRMFCVLSASLALIGCTVGSGDLATESREVSGFDEVVLQTSGDVVIDVTGSESLEIEADDNVLPLLTSDVVGGRLELGTSGSFTSSRSITYTITVADLRRVEINGSGDVRVTDLDGGTFEASISGSGSVEPSGTCDALDVTIGGSGEFDGEDLECEVGTVTVSGSGSAVVNVSDDLDVRVSGSGDVRYIGDPTLDQSISGSGDVSRR